MPSLEQMADKGQRKYRAKVDNMEQAYASAKSRAVRNYKDLPFGNTVTQNYEDGMQNAVTNYKDSVDRSSADKWKENWLAKMRE